MTLEDELNNTREFMRHVASVYQDVVSDDYEDGETFQEILAVWAFDLENRISGAEQTLETRSTLQHGLRLAIEFQEKQVKENFADLEGWNQQTAPKNLAQKFSAFMTNLIMELSTSIWAIEQRAEERRPGSIAVFNKERASYHKLRLEWAAFEKANPLPKTH